MIIPGGLAVKLFERLQQALDGIVTQQHQQKQKQFFR